MEASPPFVELALLSPGQNDPPRTNAWLKLSWTGFSGRLAAAPESSAPPRESRDGVDVRAADGYPASSRIMALAFSAIMTVAAWVLELTSCGMIEESTTRSPSSP